MKNSKAMLINLVVLLVGVSSLHAKETNYYEQLIILFKADNPRETERYLNSLGFDELLALSKQACPATIGEDDHDARLEAMIVVNLSLQKARKRFPKQILGACLKGVKSSKETPLWRGEVLRWLKSAYRKPSSTEGDVKQVVSTCAELAFSRKENVHVRIRAIRTYSGLLHSRSLSLYRAQKAFQEAIKKDRWNKRAAMKAAVEKGFRNPWEDSLIKAGERILTAVADAKDNAKFKYFAIGSLRWILRATYSGEARKSAQLKVKAILTDSPTPTAVAVLAGQMLTGVFKDMAILEEIEKRLPEARKAEVEARKDLAKAKEDKNIKGEVKAKEVLAGTKDTRERCEALISRLKAGIEEKKQRENSTEEQCAILL